jgi:hypothetical protein
MFLVTALNTAMRDYFDRSNFVLHDRRKKYSEYVKCKSVTNSRFATHKWAQILQIRKIAGKGFSPIPVCRYNLVRKRCFTYFLITNSQRLFRKS